jgi:hypothetical protein
MFFNKYISMIKIKKKYQLFGAIILCVSLIIISLLITPKNQTQFTSETSYTTPNTEITTSQENLQENPVESTATWNQQFNDSLAKYEKTDKARIDQTLSPIRLKSPIAQDGFTVEYNYANATYTFNLQQPEETNKEKALIWLKSLGISQDDLKLIRVKWVTAP